MSSKEKHMERSRRSNTNIFFKSEDCAKHNIVNGMLVFSPKKPKPSKFLEDRKGGDKIIAEYVENKKKRNKNE